MQNMRTRFQYAEYALPTLLMLYIVIDHHDRAESDLDGHSEAPGAVQPPGPGHLQSGQCRI